jgi:hypothetical protein
MKIPTLRGCSELAFTIETGVSVEPDQHRQRVRLCVRVLTALVRQGRERKRMGNSPADVLEQLSNLVRHW